MGYRDIRNISDVAEIVTGDVVGTDDAVLLVHGCATRTRPGGQRGSERLVVGVGKVVVCEIHSCTPRAHALSSRFSQNPTPCLHAPVILPAAEMAQFSCHTSASGILVDDFGVSVHGLKKVRGARLTFETEGLIVFGRLIYARIDFYRYPRVFEKSEGMNERTGTGHRRRPKKGLCGCADPTHPSHNKSVLLLYLLLLEGESAAALRSWQAIVQLYNYANVRYFASTMAK